MHPLTGLTSLFPPSGDKLQSMGHARVRNGWWKEEWGHLRTGEVERNGRKWKEKSLVGFTTHSRLLAGVSSIPLSPHNCRNPQEFLPDCSTELQTFLLPSCIFLLSSFVASVLSNRCYLFGMYAPVLCIYINIVYVYTWIFRSSHIIFLPLVTESPCHDEQQNQRLSKIGTDL